MSRIDRRETIPRRFRPCFESPAWLSLSPLGPGVEFVVSKRDHVRTESMLSRKVWVLTPPPKRRATEIEPFRCAAGARIGARGRGGGCNGERCLGCLLLHNADMETPHARLVKVGIQQGRCGNAEFRTPLVVVGASLRGEVDDAAVLACWLQLGASRGQPC